MPARTRLTWTHEDVRSRLYIDGGLIGGHPSSDSNGLTVNQEPKRCSLVTRYLRVYKHATAVLMSPLLLKELLLMRMLCWSRFYQVSMLPLRSGAAQ
ncbi:hypothetical protein V5799_004627 [Amblyomma americanum]|uniref:Uncharacterized protein n=1 Tax=Amblyomma americanum TaxID=6943 RepID=A0AAQ4D5J9_AMBAM